MGKGKKFIAAEKHFLKKEEIYKKQLKMYEKQAEEVIKLKQEVVELEKEKAELNIILDEALKLKDLTREDILRKIEADKGIQAMSSLIMGTGKTNLSSFAQFLDK